MKKYLRLFNYFYYFSKFICVNLIRFKSKKLCKKISSNYKGPYLFKPYEVFDCITLHEGILKNLNKSSKSNLDKNKNKINFLSFVKKDSCDKGFIGLQNSLLKNCIKNNIEDLYYPLLDSFIRIIPWKFFFQVLK